MPENEPATVGAWSYCGEPNSHSRTNCRRCHYRLLWADTLEGITDTNPKFISHETSWLDKVLKQWGLLPNASSPAASATSPSKSMTGNARTARNGSSVEHESELDPRPSLNRMSY